MKLYIASVKATGGNYEGEIFSSSPEQSEFGAVEVLQQKAHDNGVSADWTKVYVEAYELVGGRGINPAEEFGPALFGVLSK